MTLMMTAVIMTNCLHALSKQTTSAYNKSTTTKQNKNCRMRKNCSHWRFLVIVRANNVVFVLGEQGHSLVHGHSGSKGVDALKVLGLVHHPAEPNHRDIPKKSVARVLSSLSVSVHNRCVNTARHYWKGIEHSRDTSGTYELTLERVEQIIKLRTASTGARGRTLLRRRLFLAECTQRRPEPR